MWPRKSILSAYVFLSEYNNLSSIGLFINMSLPHRAAGGGVRGKYHYLGI